SEFANMLKRRSLEDYVKEKAKKVKSGGDLNHTENGAASSDSMDKWRKQRYEILTAENKRLKEEGDKKDREISKLQSDLDFTKRRVAQVEEKYRQLNKKRTHIDVLEYERDGLQGALREFKEKNIELETENKALRAEIDLCMKQIADKKDLAEAGETIDRLNGDNQRIIGELQKSLDIRKELNGQLDESEKKARNMVEELDRCKKELKIVREHEETMAKDFKKVVDGIMRQRNEQKEDWRTSRIVSSSPESVHLGMNSPSDRFRTPLLPTVSRGNPTTVPGNYRSALTSHCPQLPSLVHDSGVFGRSLFFNPQFASPADHNCFANDVHTFE
ncbi:hypothetical protein PFISCL1PPCAC_6678, partial [Pristionchus fissidentatus]